MAQNYVGMLEWLKLSISNLLMSSLASSIRTFSSLLLIWSVTGGMPRPSFSGSMRRKIKDLSPWTGNVKGLSEWHALGIKTGGDFVMVEGGKNLARNYNTDGLPPATQCCRKFKDIAFCVLLIEFAWLGPHIKPHNINLNYFGVGF